MQSEGVVCQSVSLMSVRMKSPRTRFAFVTLSTILILAASAGQAEGNDQERKTKYGCEGTTLEIQCEEGTLINLVRANFGRFSISICNKEGVTNWSVNCMEPRTLRIINARCESKPRCEIPVDESLFGDPCPGTQKYVEVHYTCQPIKSSRTTSKPQPPWLLDLAATPAAPVAKLEAEATTTTTASTTTTTTATTTAKSTSAQTTVTSANATSTPAKVSPTTKQTDLRSNEVTEPDYAENPSSVVTSSHVSSSSLDPHEVEVLKELKDHCPPLTVRNLFWNWTFVGQEAIQVCPPGAAGFARWTCGKEGRWSSRSPNLGECQSLWLSRLESRMHAIGSMDSISSELAALTEAKSLYGGDIPIVTSIIQGLAHRLRQELYIIPSQDEKEMKVSELLQNVLKTCSNLLDQAQILAWRDLPEDKRSGFATAMLLGVEENALLLAETINNEKNLIEATNNILASIRIMRARDAGTQVFPHLESVRWEEDSNLLIPSAGLVETSVNGAVRIIFFLYNNLESIIPGVGTKFVNSKILGATTSKGRDTKLSIPVTFTLRHLQSENIRNAQCASWDYSNREWSTKDCAVIATNATFTKCKCDRVSLYAALAEDLPSAAAGAAAEPHAASGDKLSPHLSIIIACIVAIVLSIVIVVVIVILVKRFDLKPRVQKFVQANGGAGGIFRCKKSDSTTSSCGFYPPLTSSPTSTTVSGGTPTNQTYLEQVLKAHNSEFHQINKSQNAVPQTMDNQQARTIYRTNFGGQQSLGGRHLVALNQYDPFGHHIYMEIDPIYAHLEAAAAAAAAEANSDIHLSDISDDDVRRNSHNQRFAEERPLIRGNIRRSIEQQLGFQHQQQHQQGDNDTAGGLSSQRQFLTAHRLQRNANSSGPLSSSSFGGNNSLRMARTAQRSHSKPRLQHGQHSLVYPVVGNAANLEAPITIALQGGEQFVSLKIDQRQQNERVYQ